MKTKGVIEDLKFFKKLKKGKKKQSHKNYNIYIYMKFDLKIGSLFFFFFFCKVIVGYKNEN